MQTHIEPRGGRFPLVEGLIRVQRLLSELIVLLMALSIAAEVVCRGLFGFSLMIVEETGGYLLAALVFLGMGIALHDRVLFRVEFLIHALPERTRQSLQLLFDLLSLAFMLILGWQLLRLVMQSYERGVQAATTLATPLYLPQMLMVAGAVSVILVLLKQVAEDVAQLQGGRHE